MTSLRSHIIFKYYSYLKSILSYSCQIGISPEQIGRIANRSNTTGSFLIFGFWNALQLTSIKHPDYTSPPNFPTKYICIILQQSKGLCLATAKINQRADTTKCQPYFFQLIQSVLSNTSLFYKSNKEGGDEKQQTK